MFLYLYFLYILSFNPFLFIFPVHVPLRSFPFSLSCTFINSVSLSCPYPCLKKERIPGGHTRMRNRILPVTTNTSTFMVIIMDPDIQINSETDKYWVDGHRLLIIDRNIAITTF